MLLLFPTSGQIISPFGASRGGGSRSHEGIDIGAPVGTPIRAAEAGRVTHAGWLGSGPGVAVKIDHGSFETKYFHCSQVYVSAGQGVTRGQVVAAVGKTGNASGTAPHLHFEVHLKNRGAVNPVPYFGGGDATTPQITGYLPAPVSNVFNRLGQYGGPAVLAAAFLLLVIVARRR